MKRILVLALGGITLALGACTTPSGPVEVNRFHILDQRPLSQAPSANVVAGPGIDPDSLEFRTFRLAVERELNQLGIATETAGPPALEARIRYERLTEAPVRQGSPVSVGVGGSTGSYGSGLGVGVGIDLSGPPKPAVLTRLFVALVDRQSGETIWEGRAENAVKQGSPLADTPLAAAKLASALFTNFPGTSGETIEVP